MRLPTRRVWLRVASPVWRDPLDPSWAGERGGRWNAPNAGPTLYLNGDVTTARLQIERMLAGSPVTVDDLDEDAYVLVAATLPAMQTVADAVTERGVRALGLPASYPRRADGSAVGHDACQRAGARVRERRLRGVWCRSACTPDGRGRELAWFPATARSSARPVWTRPLSFGRWRYAVTWRDLDLDEQPDPTAA